MENEYTLLYTAGEIEERLTRAGNSILFTEQELTEEEKLRARLNIGIVLEEPEEPEAGGVTTKEVEYTYSGDINSDEYTWVTMPDGSKGFVKVADIPNGEIDLIGGVVRLIVPTNEWQNREYTITEEMLNTTVNVGGVDIKPIVSGLTQILYQHTGAAETTPCTNIVVCTKAGSYDLAFDGWMSTINFSETGVYFLDDRAFGGKKYISSLTCTVTSGSGGTDESEEVEETPIEYNGNEIQVFTRGICIGDSITEGIFNHDDAPNNGQLGIKKYAYPSALKRITGIDIVNAGISGSTSKTWYEASLDSTTQWGRWVNNEWAWTENPSVGESDTVSTTIDYSGYDFAVIHLGINDIGMMGDATLDETVSTFETNINNIINKLKTANSGIRVFLCTIIPSYAVPGNVAYEAINEKVRAIANATDNVFLIDLNVYSECFRGTPYENQHLTAIGYHKMATEIKALISYTIKNNLDAFKTVQFIGTEYSGV